MIDDCLFCRCRGLSFVQGVKKIDDCLFCRCRGLSCVQGVRMIDDCSFCRCRGLSCVQGVLLGWYIIVCFVDVLVFLVLRELR